MPIILGIESSCDETSASICNDGVILSNVIANQTIHAVSYTHLMDNTYFLP